MSVDIRSQLLQRLQSLLSSDFREGHLDLLKALGYESDKTIPIPEAKPVRFIEIAEAGSGVTIDKIKAKYDDWGKADILFQLTDEELSGQISLFDATELKPKLLQSYLFFAIELKGTCYSRTDLSSITRQINRLFPMPVMVFYTYNGELSIAVINRRRNRREEHKDVLGKVTLIHGINLREPHRGHLDILDSFSVTALTTGKQRIDSFDSLHAAWEAIFNIELLNKKFYRDLSNWYFWAMRHCHFPLLDEASDRYFLFKDREKVREHEAKNLIRLLTRILFVWFIKERNLVPDALFAPEAISDDFLDNFDPESKDTRYYKAILQNLFFAVLNQTHGKREFRKQGQHHNTTNLLRYEALLKNPQRFVETVEAVTPFLNGGLFDCLDYPHPTKKGPQGGAVTIYEDGFSDRKDNSLVVPDFLFFGTEQKGVDLSAEFGDPKKKNETVRGLIHILNSYKFTVVENTPIEQEIALDPELLGQVFENLLASYNEETKTTARKQTGSFYTPRPIVDYMVDESLKAHLRQALVAEAGMAEADAREGLDILFAYTERAHAFNDREKDVLIRAIDSCKILDPACGSGAFPMGTLQKLVFILSKLDPGDELWEKRQLAKVDKLIEAAQDIDDTTFRERAIADAEAQKRDIEEAFANNELGYGRKLYLIENCLYGVDIQSIATQVSKLRFFISLVVDQAVDPQRENFGVRPLPNLETKFVTADTLIQIAREGDQLALGDSDKINKLQQDLKQVRHNLFSAKTPRTKRKYREEDERLRKAIATELKENGWQSTAADKLAAWDPYDQNASAPFFDPEWMFGIKSFSIVIANPPYVVLGKNSADTKKRNIFLTTYKVAEYKCDLYALFIEAGIRFLREKGYLTYIVPNPWLTQKYFSKLRKFLLTYSSIREVITIEPSVFESAVVDNAIILTQKLKQDSSSPLKVCALQRINEIETAKRLIADQSEWDVPPSFVFDTRSLTTEGALAKKIICNCQPLESLARASIGCQAYNRSKHSEEIIKSRAFHSSEKETPDHLLELGGKQVGRYEVEIRSDKWIKYGEWLHDYRSPEWLSGPRVLIREITGRAPKRIFAAYTEEYLAFYKTVLCVIPNERTENMARFMCAVLNSSVISFVYPYAANKFVTETFPRISVADLKALPVPRVTAIAVEEISILVILLENALSNKSQAYSPFIEDLIDACVMECYFYEHMADRDLLFLDELAPSLKSYASDGSESQQQVFLEQFVATHNAPKAKVRNKLLRLTADSPDLLTVIKNGGRS